MTLSISYARFFRVACSVLQVLLAVGIILVLLFAAMQYALGGKSTPISLPHVDLLLKPVEGPGKPDGRSVVNFVLARSSISIARLPPGTGLEAYSFISLLLPAVFGFMIVRLGRRLFFRIEKREAFDPGNPQLLRQIALLELAFGVVQSILNIWYANRAAEVLDGILAATANIQARHGIHLSQFAWADAIFGFLLLLLAEVYREAVTLKEESALTI